MRFVDSLGNMIKARQGRVQQKTMSDDDVKDTTKLSQVISDLQARVARLEQQGSAGEPIEFELTTTAASSHSLYHGFPGPVRFTIVSWRCSAATAPIIREDFTNTTNKTLVLTSGVAGRAIIRVEPSNYTPRPGLT